MACDNSNKDSLSLVIKEGDHLQRIDAVTELTLKDTQVVQNIKLLLDGSGTIMTTIY